MYMEYCLYVCMFPCVRINDDDFYGEKRYNFLNELQFCSSVPSCQRLGHAVELLFPEIFSEIADPPAFSLHSHHSSRPTWRIFASHTQPPARAAKRSIHDVICRYDAAAGTRAPRRRINSRQQLTRCSLHRSPGTPRTRQQTLIVLSLGNIAR